MEKIIDMVKIEDDGFEYGGKVIFYKEDMMTIKSR